MCHIVKSSLMALTSCPEPSSVRYSVGRRRCACLGADQRSRRKKVPHRPKTPTVDVHDPNPDPLVPLPKLPSRISPSAFFPLVHRFCPKYICLLARILLPEREKAQAPAKMWPQVSTTPQWQSLRTSNDIFLRFRGHGSDGRQGALQFLC